jgi:hypothetical protein
VKTQRRKSDTKCGTDAMRATYVRIDFCPGFVQVIKRAARKLELSTGFQSDRKFVADQSYYVSLIENGLQSLFDGEKFKHFANSIRLIRNRGIAMVPKSKAFVLGADTKLAQRLGACLEPFSKLLQA